MNNFGNYLQEDVEEKIISDSSGHNDNVCVSPGGAIAILTRTKVHVLYPRAEHQAFFEGDWFLVEETKSKSSSQNEVLSIESWSIQQQTSESTRFFKQACWIRDSEHGRTRYLIGLLLHDSTFMLFLHTPSGDKFAVPFGNSRFVLHVLSHSNTFNFSTSNDFLSFGPILRFSSDVENGLIVTAHEQFLVLWRCEVGVLQCHLSLSLQSLASSTYNGFNVSRLCVRALSDGHWSLILGQESGLVIVLSITLEPSTGTFTCAVRNEIRTNTPVLEVTLVHEKFFVVTSDAILSGEVGKENTITTLNSGVDITSLSSYQPLALTTTDACIMMSTMTGDILFANESVNDISREPKICFTEKWCSQRSLFGIAGACHDPISSLVFCAYRIPPILSNSREVQLRIDLTRPRTAFRCLASPFLPVEWVIAPNTSAWILLQFAENMSRQPSHSGMYVLLAITTTVAQMREKFATKRLESLPQAMADAQAFHLAHRDNEEILFQRRRRFVVDGDGDEQIMEEDEDEEQDDEEEENDDDDNDTSDSETGDGPSLLRKLSKKSPSSGQKKGKKGGREKPMPGFGLTYLYESLQDYLPPNPVELAIRVISSFFCSAALASALIDSGHTVDTLKSSEGVLEMTKSGLLATILESAYQSNESSQRLWLDHIARFPPSMALVDRKLRLLQSLHLIVRGLISMTGLDNAPTHITDALQAIHRLIANLHCIRNISRLTSLESTRTEACIQFVLRSKCMLSICDDVGLPREYLAQAEQWLESGGISKATVPLHDVCAICEGPVPFDPWRPLHAYCSSCGLDIDRCCYSMRLITSTTDNSNQANASSELMEDATSSNAEASAVDIIYRCTICFAVTSDALARQSAVLLDNCSIRHLYCPYCNILMLKL